MEWSPWPAYPGARWKNAPKIVTEYIVGLGGGEINTHPTDGGDVGLTEQDRRDENRSRGLVSNEAAKKEEPPFK